MSHGKEEDFAMGFKQYQYVLLVVALPGLAACGDKGSSYSISGTEPDVPAARVLQPSIIRSICSGWSITSASMDPAPEKYDDELQQLRQPVCEQGVRLSFGGDDDRRLLKRIAVQ